MGNPQSTIFHYADRNDRHGHVGQALPSHMTACEALDYAGGYDVSLVPAAPYIVNGLELPNPNYGIVGGPFDGNYRLYGEVKTETFPLLGPRKICELWDTHVKLPVSVIGAVNDGGTFILASNLGACDIQGDEINQYLTLINPLDGRNAIEAFMTSIFLWCLNQIKNAIRQAEGYGKIRHHQFTEEDLVAWLTFLPERGRDISNVMCEVYTLLADTPVNDVLVEESLNRVLPLPEDPENKQDVIPQSILLRNIETYDPRMLAVLKQRQAVLDLFHSDLRMRPACDGTMYGLLNAYTETIQHGGLRLADAETRAYQNLLGPKAQVNSRALNVLVEMAGK